MKNKVRVEQKGKALVAIVLNSDRLETGSLAARDSKVRNVQRFVRQLKAIGYEVEVAEGIEL